MSGAGDGVQIRHALGLAGDVGRDLLAVEWGATPIGPPEEWPNSLCTVVRALLASRFSMWMSWGPELTFFCNDAYRRDTLAGKYPWALGRPSREVWPEIWPDIGPRIASVIETGAATWDESLLLFLERNGYPEETYHTFSYSPLTDDAGLIAGHLCVVTEDTERVIGERHMATLRDLGAASSAVREEAAFLAAVSGHLERRRDSLPFTVLYLFDEDGAARLGACSGIARGHAAAPSRIDPRDAEPAWPMAGAALEPAVLVEDLRERFGELPSGVWEDPPRTALVLPLPQPGLGARPLGAFVAALNHHRPLDESYRSFLSLVAGQLSAGIASARAHETERRRAEELAELDAAKTAFFTSISHELRTPLTLMLGPAADALADTAEPLAERQRERVALIERNGERLLALVNTLLDFSRLQSGRASPQFEAVDLGAYTAELVAMFESAYSRAGLRLEIDRGELTSAVHVDREMWAQIVLNLLSNALKFTFEGGVAVALRERDGVARLTVSDTGIGIVATEQRRLFERFHRVIGARTRSHEGSGIGLALVAELAALHGGSVAVTSEPGAGSTFSVELPIGDAHLDPGQIAGSPRELSLDRRARSFLREANRWLEEEPPVRAGSEGAERPRVLVVDDNADMRAYVTALLDSDYRIERAADGIEALARARDELPDLILSDVMMPRLDGFGLVSALRADPRTARVPVIMLSARAGAEASVEGLQSGADDYLIKPFSASELHARIHANISMARSREDAGRRAAEHARALEALSEAALALTREIDPDAVLARLAAQARVLAGAAAIAEPVEELIGTVIAASLEGYETPDDVAVLALRRHAAWAVLALTVPMEARALSPLRAQLRGWLREVGADERETADVVLAVSEAAMNAIEHSGAGGELAIRGTARDGWMSVEIADAGSWDAVPTGRDRGHGLRIMREVMDDVAIHRAAEGTRVQLRRRLASAA